MKSISGAFFLPAPLQLLVFMMVASRAAAGVLELNPPEESQHKSVGHNLFISCTATRTKHQHRFMWTGPDGKQIPEYSGSDRSREEHQRVGVEEAGGGETGLNLMIVNISRADAGRYTCSANLDGEEITTSFVLHIHSLTSFEGTDRHQSIEEGADSDIVCRAEGDPPPREQWRRQGSLISVSNSKFSMSRGPPFVLTVHNVSFDDAGTYRCTSVQLSRHVSAVENFDINVTVHHAPRLMPAADSHSFGFIGGTVNLSCTARAVPYANFTWHKNGRLIRPGGQHNQDHEEEVWANESFNRVDSIGRSANSQRYSGRQYDHHSQQLNMNTRSNEERELGDPRYTILAVNHTTSFLEINISDVTVFGKYECRADNPLGSDARMLDLRQGLQPTVPIVKVKKGGTGTHSLTLSLRVMEDEGTNEQAVTGFRVQYKKAGDERSDAVEFRRVDAEEVEADGGYRYRLTSLQPATLYVLRVASRNVAGLSRYSEHLVQKTKPMPVAQVRTSVANHVVPVFVGVLLMALALILTFRAD